MFLKRINLEVLEVPERTTEIPEGYEAIMEVTPWEVFPSPNTETGYIQRKGWERSDSRIHLGQQRLYRFHVRGTKSAYRAAAAEAFNARGLRIDVAGFFQVESVDDLYRHYVPGAQFAPHVFRIACGFLGWFNGAEYGYGNQWSGEKEKSLDHWLKRLRQEGNPKRRLADWKWEIRSDCGTNRIMDPLWVTMFYASAKCCGNPRHTPKWECGNCGLYLPPTFR